MQCGLEPIGPCKGIVDKLISFQAPRIIVALIQKVKGPPPALSRSLSSDLEPSEKKLRKETLKEVGGRKDIRRRDVKILLDETFRSLL